MDPKANTTTGIAIRDLRVAANLTQSQLAERLGKPQSFVSKTESGERSLRAYELIPLARALGVSAHDVLDALMRELG